MMSTLVFDVNNTCAMSHIDPCIIYYIIVKSFRTFFLMNLNRFFMNDSCYNKKSVHKKKRTSFLNHYILRLAQSLKSCTNAKKYFFKKFKHLLNVQKSLHFFKI